MKIASHLEKIERLKALRERLDPAEDFEIWAWTSMTIATNGINAVHHHLGLADVTEFFPHQIPGVYVRPEPEDGHWQKVIAPPGDVIHVGLPPLKGLPPEELKAAYASLEVLEQLRERYVRGNTSISEVVITETERAYVGCLSITNDLLARRSGMRT